MSEYTKAITICDGCYPDFLPSFSFFPLEQVKGVFRGPFEKAQKEGWQERDYGQICPDCVNVETQDDGGEVLMGEAALAAVAPPTSEE